MCVLRSGLGIRKRRFSSNFATNPVKDLSQVFPSTSPSMFLFVMNSDVDRFVLTVGDLVGLVGRALDRFLNVRHNYCRLGAALTLGMLYRVLNTNFQCLIVNGRLGVAEE